MGKHYCDYCDVFLTHDSISVRKAHNSGRNHLQNVREYYQTLEPDQIQQVLDNLAHEYHQRGIEKPRDLLQPAGSSFMTFGSGPLSGSSDRTFRPQSSSRPPMGGASSSGGAGPNRDGGYRGGGPGGYGRYGNDASSRDQGPPPNYNRPPPQGGPYSRPPPNMMGSGATVGNNGAYPARGPPPGYGGPPPSSYPSGPPPNIRGPPPALAANGAYSAQPRSSYGPR